MISDVIDGKVADRRIHNRVLENSALMMVCKLVSAVVSLLVVPVIVSKLGMTGFGTWEVMVATSSLCAMFQLATTVTLLWQISSAYGSHDHMKAKRLVRLGVFVTLMQLCFLLPVIYIFRHAIIHVFKVPPEMVSTATSVLPYLGGFMILGGINECMGAMLSGYQRSGLVTIVQTLAQLFNYSCVVVFLYMGFGLRSLLFGLLCGFVVTGLGLFVATARYCGSISLLPAIPSRQEIVEMRRYFGLMIVGSVSAALREQTDKIVLATFASPVWVGYYGIAARLVGLVMIVNQFFYIPMIAAAGALNAACSWDGVRRLYSTMMLVVPITAGFVVMIVGGLCDSLVVLWMGHRISQVVTILTLLLIGNASAVMLTGPGAAICKGIGKVWIEAIYWISNVALNLFFTIVLIMLIGPIGTVIASGGSWFLTSILFIFVLHRNIKLPIAATRKGLLIFAIVMLLIILLRLASSLMLPVETRSAATIRIVYMTLVASAGYVGLLSCCRIIGLSQVKQLLNVLKTIQSRILYRSS